MKTIVIIPLCVVITFNLLAQKETFDLAMYTAPVGWKKENSKDVVSYSTINNSKGIYCQLGIYRSVPSRGSLQADFEGDWQDLIVRPFQPSTKPELTTSQPENGWEVQVGAAPYEFNGAPAAAMLVTLSGHGRCMSMVILTNTEDYQSEIEKFLVSVDMRIPETTNETNAAAPIASTTTATPDNSNVTANNTGTSVVGSWGKSNAVGQLYNRYGTYSYNKQQYTFQPDGTYRFLAKNYSEQYDETLLIKEHGTYTITGSTLTLSPQASVIEAWTKKNGGDNWNQLKTSQKRTLEKTTYTVSFSGKYLIFKTDKQTERDGVFNSGNGTFYSYGPPDTFTPIKLPGE